MRNQNKKSPGIKLLFLGLSEGDFWLIAIKTASTTTNFSKGDFDRDLPVLPSFTTEPFGSARIVGRWLRGVKHSVEDFSQQEADEIRGVE